MASPFKDWQEAPTVVFTSGSACTPGTGTLLEKSLQSHRVFLSGKFQRWVSAMPGMGRDCVVFIARRDRTSLWLAESLGRTGGSWRPQQSALTEGAGCVPARWP